MPAAAAKAAVCRTLEELAAAHGVSKQAVWKWTRDPRWAGAGFSVRGPWRGDAVERQKAWRQEVLQENRAADPDAAMADGKLGKAKTIAQIKVLVEREANMRVDRLIKEKQYVARAEAEEATAAKLRAIRVALMAVPRALRQILADQVDAGKVEEILAGALRALCVEGFER